MFSLLLIVLALGLVLAGLLMLVSMASTMRRGNSLVTSEDLIGQVGHVRLPCTPQNRGLVRLNVRGSLMDVPAYSCAGALQRGRAVMVVEMRGGDVWLTLLSEPRDVPSPDSQTIHD